MKRTYIRMRRYISAHSTKLFFTFCAAYLGWQCFRGSLWIPFGLSIVLLIFIVSTKNKQLQ